MTWSEALVTLTISVAVDRHHIAPFRSHALAISAVMLLSAAYDTINCFALIKMFWNTWLNYENVFKVANDLCVRDLPIKWAVGSVLSLLTLCNLFPSSGGRVLLAMSRDCLFIHSTVRFRQQLPPPARFPHFFQVPLQTYMQAAETNISYLIQRRFELLSGQTPF